MPIPRWGAKFPTGSAWPHNGVIAAQRPSGAPPVYLRWDLPEPALRVGTDRQGRFEHSGWRPRIRGYHELWDFYRSQRRGFTDDHACPRRFAILASVSCVSTADSSPSRSAGITRIRFKRAATSIPVTVCSPTRPMKPTTSARKVWNVGAVNAGASKGQRRVQRTRHDGHRRFRPASQRPSGGEAVARRAQLEGEALFTRAAHHVESKGDLLSLLAVYEVGASAPWPGLDMRLTYIARPRLLELSRRDDGTLARPIVVRSPRPTLAGPSGVRIALKTVPQDVDELARERDVAAE